MMLIDVYDVYDIAVDAAVGVALTVALTCSKDSNCHCRWSCRCCSSLREFCLLSGYRLIVSRLRGLNGASANGPGDPKMDFA